MLVRDPSTGMSSQGLPVYMLLLTPATRCVPRCAWVAWPDLAWVRAVRTPKYQSPS